MGERRASLSIEDAARWVWAFFAREWRLLLPVALAFIALPQVALELLVDLPATPLVAPTPGAAPAVDPKMLWVFPVLLLNLYGQLTLVALALAPGRSVGEALRLAAGRLGAVIGVGLLVMLGVVAGVTFVAILLRLLLPTLPPSAGLYMLLTVVTTVALAIVSLRFALIMPAIVARRLGPVAALKQAFVLSRGRFWTLAGGLLAALLAMALVGLTIQLTIGSVLLLIGRLSGFSELAIAVQTLVSGTAAAVLTTLLTLFLVALYGQADQGRQAI